MMMMLLVQHREREREREEHGIVMATHMMSHKKGSIVDC